MKKPASFLGSMALTGILLVNLIGILAIATFIESGFGTASARALFYGARWFEFLFLVIAVNIVASMFRYRMFSWKKIVVLVFHLSFLVILAGAAITRYISFEGSMHIRENSISNTMLSRNAYVEAVLSQNGDTAVHLTEVMITPKTQGNYRLRTKVGNEKVKVKSEEYLFSMPQMVEQWVHAPEGIPYLQLVFVGGNDQATTGIASGTSIQELGLDMAFDLSDSPAVLNFVSEEGGPVLYSGFALTTMRMGGEGEKSYDAGEPVPVEVGMLYSLGHIRMAVQGYIPSARKQLVEMELDPEDRQSRMPGVKLELAYRGMKSQFNIPGMPGLKGNPVDGTMGDLSYSFSFGSKEIDLPFALFLKDFEVERYPGSQSPSSFASEVRLVDKELDIMEDRRIFMNNVLKHRGYRFYQSSYDSDEMGSILSVNKDFLGTFVTYVGYFLLIAGMLLALFIPGTRFHGMIKKSAGKTRILLMFLITTGFALQINAQDVPPADVAKEFGKLWVQDQGGRFKPVNTLSHEVVRKITGKSQYKSYKADQVLLGMILYPEHWENEAMFKIKNPGIHELLDYKGEKVRYRDFFDQQGQYILSDSVNAAFSEAVADQNSFDKELIKVNDRINAMYLVLTGGMLHIFADTTSDNHKWLSQADLRIHSHAVSTMAKSASGAYLDYLEKIREAKYNEAAILLDQISAFQNQEKLLPSDSRGNQEILYNKINIFPRLARFYLLFGIILLAMQFLMDFKERKWARFFFRVGVIHLAVAFVLHTLALAMRWYVSGHAPMSNGYESMIFVSWISLLAGLLFVKRSGHAMGLTSILAALALVVAGMSNMNPEITNLVPVLKSPWLTIHVAVIMAGYGFLGMASIMGLLNVTLYTFSWTSNRDKMGEVIAQVTRVNRMTMIIGLYLMTAGVFLGGVWANESWGRYWGWDPKETWALITVLVYAFVSHMHRIPGLRGSFSFNLASFISYSSVMMTYFGVNYFLGGIHSYASGSAYRVPFWVYLLVVFFTGLAIVAFIRYLAVYSNEPTEDEDQGQ